MSEVISGDAHVGWAVGMVQLNEGKAQVKLKSQLKRAVLAQ